MTTLIINTCAIILIFLIISIILGIFYEFILPKIINLGLTETERNPKWITSKLTYHGFEDIDIVLCESKWGALPRIRVNKNDCSKLELWVSKDVSVDDVEQIGSLALVAKIKIKYNLWYPEKPIYWLSILCYMLDGGEIEMADKELNNKRLDQ